MGACKMDRQIPLQYDQPDFFLFVLIAITAVTAPTTPPVIAALELPLINT